MTTFSERLRSAVRESPLNQAELASRAGYKSQGAIGNMLGGRAGARNIGSLAAALGVEALWLQTGKGPRYKSGSPLLPAANIDAEFIKLWADASEFLAEGLFDAHEISALKAQLAMMVRNKKMRAPAMSKELAKLDTSIVVMNEDFANPRKTQAVTG